MKPRAREIASDAIAMLTAYGLAPTIDTSGKHAKVRWIDTHGRRRFFVIAKTPSGWRHRLNSAATLRRLLRNGKEGSM
jgi:hypothetical protein